MIFNRPSAPQMPGALLPEFSDSRDEPFGPTNVGALEVIEISRRRGGYLAALHALADAWAAGDVVGLSRTLTILTWRYTPCKTP